jgi:hypothetical protein
MDNRRNRLNARGMPEGNINNIEDLDVDGRILKQSFEELV